VAQGGVKRTQPLLMAAGSNKVAGKLPVATIPSLLDTVVVTRRRRRVTSFAFPSGGAPTGASADGTSFKAATTAALTAAMPTVTMTSATIITTVATATLAADLAATQAAPAVVTVSSPYLKPSNLFFVAGQKRSLSPPHSPPPPSPPPPSPPPPAPLPSRRLLPHLRHSQGHHHRAHAAATTIAAAALAATATESICYVMYHACVRSWSGVRWCLGQISFIMAYEREAN